MQVYEVFVDNDEIKSILIASDSITSAIQAARRFGYIPIRAILSIMWLPGMPTIDIV